MLIWKSHEEEMYRRNGMDIYQFIDSRDIRNYLQDIKYKFRLLES